MAEPPIEVVIIKGRPECDAACGTDWSAAETEALVRERVRERFGDGVKISVLAKKDAETALIINGQPRIYGEFNLRTLLDVIEAELELRRG